MADGTSVNEILDFAIKEEEKAAAFYTVLAGRMEKPWMKTVFNQFAKEELGHKAKLLGIKEGRLLEPAKEKVMDLKIAEYVIDVEPTPDMSYQDALILAMKAEKAAYRLYLDLAAANEDNGIKNTFLALAQEEANHKLRFEIEYDEYILDEN
jgi:rubrerythrin